MEEEELQKAYFEQQLQGAATDTSLKQMQQQMMLEDREKGLAEEQLEVNEIILDLYQLITGKKVKINDDGTTSWEEPDSNYLKIFSEYGIQKIMHLIKNYINKNTLLSNFSEEQINRIMLRVTTELNDLILLKYEDFFFTPDFEQCKTILEERMANKKKLRMYAAEILKKPITDEQAEAEVKKEMERGIELEMQKIREEERKRRLKEYGSITSYIEDQIYATLNRAWKGEERGSLRRHATFSDVRTTGAMPIQKKGGVFGWLKD
jgi:hypothetical protein